jgi:glycosyltransferase involved in cell wall biosynthesis
MKESKSSVSILIPAFNAEKWIGDTLKSAIEQTWDRKEIIVVDDGSTDGTLRIARQFESDMLRVVSQKNQGASAARNTAFSLSQGEYIQWLDADDLLAPDKIAHQMNALQRIGNNKQILLSGSWGRFIYRQDKTKFSNTSLWCDLTPLEWLIRKMSQNVFMSPASWLVSRDITEAAGPWNTKLSLDDDGEYFCRVLLSSQGTHFVPEAKSFYRDSGSNSLSYISRSNKNKMASQLLSMKFQVSYLKSLEDSDRSRAACVRYLTDSSGFFYPQYPDLFFELAEMCKELGGTLQLPHLSWKYSWIRTLFGWRMARRAQVLRARVTEFLVRSYDKMFYLIDQIPQNYPKAESDEGK